MAHSGAGLTETDLAGAFAINVALDSRTTEARVDPGALLTLTGGGSLTVSASYMTINTAERFPLSRPIR